VTEKNVTLTNKVNHLYDNITMNKGLFRNKVSSCHILSPVYVTSDIYRYR